MRDFVLEHADNLQFVVNYHSFANMLEIPYQSEETAGTMTLAQSEAYSKICEEAPLPPQMTCSNAIESLGYYVDGDFADWILSKTGIVAMSPELGSSECSETFCVAP